MCWTGKRTQQLVYEGGHVEILQAKDMWVQTELG